MNLPNLMEPEYEIEHSEFLAQRLGFISNFGRNNVQYKRMREDLLKMRDNLKEDFIND